MVYTLDKKDRNDVAEAVFKHRQAVKNILGPEHHRAPEKSEIMLMGVKLWPHTYKGGSTDREAYHRLWDWFTEQENPNLTGALALPFEQIITLGSARWADCGFPQVVVGHRYAAALMATNIPEDVLPLVRPPWPAFFIELPDMMLPILDEHGKELPLRRVLVQHIHDEKETWQFLAQTDGITTIWRHGIDTRELALSERTGTGTWEGCTFAIPIDEGVDGRTNQLVGKLIAAVCLAMSDPSNVKAHPSFGGVGDVGRQGKEPKVRTFRLGKPIEVDVRQALDDFIHNRGTRKGSSPTVQTLVRGHWKPKLSERVGYPVWIEPYWRGPLDAPILTRPVKVGDD